MDKVILLSILFALMCLTISVYQEVSIDDKKVIGLDQHQIKDITDNFPDKNLVEICKIETGDCIQLWRLE